MVYISTAMAYLTLLYAFFWLTSKKEQKETFKKSTYFFFVLAILSAAWHYSFLLTTEKTYHKYTIEYLDNEYYGYDLLCKEVPYNVDTCKIVRKYEDKDVNKIFEDLKPKKELKDV